MQARWGHLNGNSSLLTRAQEIGIDGHFMVEQSARAWNGLFMNFNGTAGVWSKKAIVSSGGWQWDTLTEDMDLSYRVQINGWKTWFIYNLVVPAELPEEIHAFKSQQFRWAKGSIQTAKKVLPSIFKSKASRFKKFQAFMHLSHYMVHPLMLCLALLAYPVLTMNHFHQSPLYYPANALILLLSIIAPNSIYLTSQLMAYKNQFSRLLYLPSVVLVGVGSAVSNSTGVFEALMGMDSPFIRTPKKGEVTKKKYKVKAPFVAWSEFLLGIYCLFSFSAYLHAGKYWIGPFLFIYAISFLYVGMLSLSAYFKNFYSVSSLFEKWFKKNKAEENPAETELSSSTI